MSIFSWLSGPNPSVKPGAASARSRGVADGAVPGEDTKTHRHARREQLYTAIREAMTRSGVLSSRFKFKVLSLDQRGDTFLVMMDLTPQEGTQTDELSDIEKQIMRHAMARFDIAVSAVYWRCDVLAFERQPKPEFAKTIEAHDSVNGEAREPHVYKTIEVDELEAFRQARLAMGEGAASMPGKGKASTVPDAKGDKKRRPASAHDFADTQVTDSIEAAASPGGLSATQYGDLH